MTNIDPTLDEEERQKTIRRSRSAWKKLSRKRLIKRKFSTKNLERLCRENATTEPTIIVHSEDVDYSDYFPNAFTLSKRTKKPADMYVDKHYRDLGKIEPESYDVALCTGLLEHVPDPQRLIDDLHRVLKPGGTVIMSASAVFSYHEGPENYFMFTTWGMKHLFRDWSEIKSVQGSSQPFETVGILMQRALMQCDINPFVRPLIELLALIIPVFDRAVSDEFDSTWKYSDDHKVDSMMPSNVQLVAIK
jgi:SAM-dependent methyltransferase